MLCCVATWSEPPPAVPFSDAMPPINVKNNPRIIAAFAAGGEAVVYMRDGEGYPAVVMKVKHKNTCT